MTTTQTPKINFREADQTIDAIAASIEDLISEDDNETQVYVLKALEDVVSNLIFDRTPQ